MNGANDNSGELRVDPLTGELIGERRQPVAYFGGYDNPPASVQVNNPVGLASGTASSGESPRRRTGLVISLFVIVALLGSVGIYFLLKPSDSDSLTAQPGRSATSVPRTSRTSLSLPPPPAVSTVSPVTPGWQGVSIAESSIAYDVPADWKVDPPGTITGFEDKNGIPVAIMRAASTFKHNACPQFPGSYRARVGIAKGGNVDPIQAAGAAANKWASAAAEKEADDPSIPQPTVVETTIQGGLKAWAASITVTITTTGGCTSPQVKVTTVAFKPKPTGDTALFVFYADQGVSDALPADIEAKIIASLRAI